jgi:integrase/recombinase XerD
MLENTSIGSIAKDGILSTVQASNELGRRLSTIIPGFLKYARFERCLSPETIIKYRDCLGTVVKEIGDMPIDAIRLHHLTELKQEIALRGAGVARISQIIFALKSLLRYSSEVLEIEVLPLEKIKVPKRQRREVIFLTNEEVNQFLNAIPLAVYNRRKQEQEVVRLDGLRFRTLVEVLLATGMRISEALSLNRDSINFEKTEAKIIGKGNKERTVFFTDRSLEWIKRYLAARSDSGPALFATKSGGRLDRADISGYFSRYARRAGLTKKVTPHILRHTTATNLLFNGCPISHVKEILGHDRLETTCKYYLGVDKRKAKEAHASFLNFE